MYFSGPFPLSRSSLGMNLAVNALIRCLKKQYLYSVPVNTARELSISCRKAVDEIS